MPENNAISAKTTDQVKTEFKQYHYERFSQDLGNWFKIVRGFGGKPINFIAQANGHFVPHRPPKCSDSLFHEYCFSVACFFTFLIPQIIAEKKEAEPLFYDYALASGWPILSCGMGGFSSAARIIYESDLAPNKDELVDYCCILSVAEEYFINEVREFLAGNEESLNKESYLRLCENTKGRIDEICEQIRFRTDEYRRSLSGESPYEFHLMRWAHAESHSEYRR